MASALVAAHWSDADLGVGSTARSACHSPAAGRGLTNQAATRRNRDGVATIRAAVDTPVHPRPRRPDRKTRATAKPVRDRRKTGPTRKRSRDATPTTSPLPPRRRQAPAPANPNTGPGKRPAGRTPQGAHPGRQVPHTISTPRRPHRVRAAILGRGFHRHVHATPTHQGTAAPARRPNH